MPGGYILTAAHCIRWEGTGSMALGDWYVETIRTSDGARHMVSPCAVEPVMDIAVLGAVDSQEMSEECDAFEKFCEATEPVPVSTNDFPQCDLSEPQDAWPVVPVHVLTHRGTWITGGARRIGAPHGNVWVTFDAQIEGGTSGGPVIDDDGRLVGVISNVSDGFSHVSNANLKAGCEGRMPRPHLALPVWVWKRIDR